MKSIFIYRNLLTIIIITIIFYSVSYFIPFHFPYKTSNNIAVLIQGSGKWLTLLISFILVKYLTNDRYFTLLEKKYNLLFFIKNIFLFLFILMLFNISIGKISLLIFPDHSSEKLSILLTVFKRNKFLLLFTAITAGIVEEIIFRGYILGKLLAITKSESLSIFSSTFLFSIMHISYGNIISIITSFVFGLLASLYYIKYSNIKLLIIAHIIWDIIAFMIALNIKN